MSSSSMTVKYSGSASHGALGVGEAEAGASDLCLHLQWPELMPPGFYTLYILKGLV